MQPLNKNDSPLQVYRNGSVWTTWTISFKAIAEQDGFTANLIRLWSFIDNKDLWLTCSPDVAAVLESGSRSLWIDWERG